MPPIKYIPILPKLTSSLESTVTAQQDALSSNITIAYTQNQNDNPIPFTSTNLPLPFRNIKKDFIFEEKYKTLLECLFKGKNSEINTLLINHVREIDKLVRSHNLSFSSAHQQFILSLSNNIPENLQDKDLDIGIDNINTLLNKILLFTQKLVEIRSRNQNKIKQYASTSTVIQPIWLFKTKTIINAKSLIGLSEEQIVQLANEPNIDKLISKKFTGKGFSVILPTITGKNSKGFNVTRKRDSTTLDNTSDIDNKRFKPDATAFNKSELATKKQLLLDEYIKKIVNFCQSKEINLSSNFKIFIDYLYNHKCSSLLDDKGKYVLGEILNKLYLLITETYKYNILNSLSCFVLPVFNGNISNIKSILYIPDEQIKDTSFNQSLFNLLATSKYKGLGYPSVDEILATKTST